MRGRLTDSRQAERSLVRGLSRCRTGGTPHPPLCRESAAATNRSRTERGDSVTVLTHKRDYTQAIPRRASRNIANGIGTESGAGSVYHAFWLAMPYNPSCVVNFTRTGGFGHANQIEGHYLSRKGARYAVVVARTNALITERLLEGCLDCLVRHGAAEESIDVVRV